MITSQASQVFELKTKKGETYIGFTMVNDPDLGTLVFLAYSKIENDIATSVNGKEAEWQYHSYNQIDSLIEFNGRRI